MLNEWSCPFALVVQFATFLRAPFTVLKKKNQKKTTWLV